VQVLADSHGHFVHLGDRDCSIQRRHQKLIEEAPAPAISTDIHNRLRAAALRVAREIGYVSAGTVEFLFDGREFFFMEMNTRLQVEHTVTEAITGLDLVEWQLRVASGEPLPLTQEEIRLDGHAIEARVCAEDPDRDFLPSAGELKLLEWPHEELVRVDAGFGTGDAVPATYDSLLGKVIAWAPERAQAATRLATALEHLYCAGVQTNDKWLSRVLRDARFLNVRHSIAFLQQSAADFAGSRDLEPSVAALAALAFHATTGAIAVVPARATTPWDLRDGFTPNLPARVAYNFTWRGHEHSAELMFARGRPSAVAVDAQAPFNIADLAVSPEVIAVCLNGPRLRARYLREGSKVHLWTAGEHFEIGLEDPRLKEFSAMTSRGGLTTPLPGVVVAVTAEVGQSVKAGDVLMVIEAMKMEHSIRAPNDGVVTVVHFRRGDRVPEASPLLELAPATTA
jgi:3-methylcrotonyl-CoA carboxylase alpha subunit